MNKSLETLLEKVILGGLAVLVFLIPLFFLSITYNFYDFNKQALLVGGVCFLLLLTFLKMALVQKVSFKQTPLDLPILLLAVVFVASTILQSVNKTEALITPGATGTIAALTILYFLITNHFSPRLASLLTKSLLASAITLSLLRLFTFLNIWSLLGSRLPAWLAEKTFTPTGSLLTTVVFLLVVLPLVLAQIQTVLKKDREGSFVTLTFHSFLLLIILVGLGTSIQQLLTIARPVLLPYQVGWAIAMETVKFTPFLGVGPEAFLNAFNQFRPVLFNTDPYWSARFTLSSNWPFQLLTTTGLLGLAVFVLLAWRVLAKRPPVFKYNYLAIILTLVILLFLPASIILLTVLVVLLALFSAEINSSEFREESKLLPWVIFVPILAFVTTVFYFGGRTYLADFYFRKSVDALLQNQGAATYNLQIQATTLNPNQADYRIAYSQTNFALANALAQNPPADGLTDQDRQDISTLIQQAIREAKVAVALDPQNAANWENLASTYRQLINFAEGADSWTIAAYNQAIALDPTNPNLRLSLGGVFYSLSRWDDAIRVFEQVTTLKPDLANGYYNLASTYREKGDLEKAATAMESARALVSPDSDDWKKANLELEALQKRIAEKTAPAKQNLKESKQPSETLAAPPQPLPEGIKPPLTLPTGAEPQIAPQ